jgi:hypothetical protein
LSALWEYFLFGEDGQGWRAGEVDLFGLWDPGRHGLMDDDDDDDVFFGGRVGGWGGDYEGMWDA